MYNVAATDAGYRHVHRHGRAGRNMLSPRPQDALQNIRIHIIGFECD